MNSNVRDAGDDDEVVKQCLKVRQVLGTSKVVKLPSCQVGSLRHAE